MFIIITTFVPGVCQSVLHAEIISPSENDDCDFFGACLFYLQDTEMFNHNNDQTLIRAL